MVVKLIIVAITLYGVRNILFGENGVENSLKWIIIDFCFGYRTFTITSGFALHPIEILIYVSVIRIIVSRQVRLYKLPVSISLLGCFFITTFLIDCLTIYWHGVLLEFKCGILLLLIFFIGQHINFTKSYIKKILKVYLYTATIISTFGILEFLFPSFMASLFGIETQISHTSSSIVFNRLAFLFWGSHLAANLIPPVFPILLLLRSERDQNINNNYLLTILVIINLFAIYLSGNRISWLIITIMLLITISLYKDYLISYMKSYAILVTIIFVAYIYSQPVEGRYISTFKALSGNIDIQYDSSGASRMYRAKIAYESMLSNPFGTGWASQGWVHSDILQIGSTIGIIPGTILLFGPLLLLFKIYKNYLWALPNNKSVFFVLLLLLIFIIISFSLNGNILLVQCGAPLYLFWAIANGYLRCNTNIA